MKYKHFKDLYDAKLIKVYKEVGKKEKVMYSAKSVHKHKDKPDFDELMNNMTIKNFLISTSLFTKAKAGAFITSLGLNEMDKLLPNINTTKYDKLVDYLKQKTNYFIADLTNFIITQYCEVEQ